MPNDIIQHVTAEDVIAILHSLGWTAKLSGASKAPNIASVINDVNFNVRFGTPAGNGWLDLTIFATFDVDQEVTPVLGASWNRRQRFARVYRTERHLVLDMDVVVNHGVSRANLRHQFAIWADVTKLFLQHLKADHEAAARQKLKGRPGKTDESAPVVNGQAGRPRQQNHVGGHMGDRQAAIT